MNNISFDDLNGRICAITGGAGVIGTTLCRALAKAGVKTAILDISKEAAEKTANEIMKETGTEMTGLEADVLDEDSLKKAKELINSRLGNIDILINGAGGNSPKATTSVEMAGKKDLTDLDSTFFGLDIESFKKVFDLNFIGTVLPCKILTKDMVDKGKGVVLNISSMNAFRPLTKIPAYSASKSSVNNFTQWLSVHLAGLGIRVNAIAPGFFLTKQNRFLLLDEKTGELTPRGRKIIEHTPVGSFGETEDLQGTLLYLLSDISRFVTGTVIPVDGGFSAYSGV